jgi:hypothetical protein
VLFSEESEDLLTLFPTLEISERLAEEGLHLLERCV